jgi:hypothetical protein
MFGCLSQVAVLASAIAAALGYFSFWWVAIPVFLAGSFQISNGPGFDVVMDANRQGRFGVFPMMLVGNILPWLAVAGVAYWITKALI